MFKRNQIIITALVVMVAAAGYLNYIDANPQVNEVMVVDQEDITGAVPDTIEVADINTNENFEISVDAQDTDQVKEINSDNIQQAEIEETANDETGTAVFVNSSQDSSYFVQAKLDREQARAKEKDLLNEMLSNDNITTEKKSQAANAMLSIQQRIEKETSAEAMIEAKGFTEAYVRIDEDTVDVVVDKSELTQAEIAQIEDIVKRKTGVTADKIRITPLKKS